MLAELFRLFLSSEAVKATDKRKSQETLKKQQQRIKGQGKNLVCKVISMFNVHD